MKYPKIAVVISTLNGEKYLSQQLESLIRQRGVTMDLYINDNCSTDNTISIIKKYQKKIRIYLTEIKYKNFFESFLFTLKKISKNYDFYAFCDQDDYWLEDRVIRGVNFLSKGNKNCPNLFLSRTYLTDEKLNIKSKSKKYLRKASFENALIQSIGGGNTYLFNQELKNIISSLKTYKFAVSHDWYIYLVTTYLGGNVIYDDFPRILYRQHSSNLIGENLSFNARISRFKKVLSGEFRAHRIMLQNVLQELIKKYPDSSKKQKALQFLLIGNSNLSIRIKSFLKSNAHRQSFLESLFFFILVALRRV